MATVSFPYDPNGNSPANLVTNERQVLSQINGDAYRYLIPDFAPFYQTNFSAKGFDAAGNAVTLKVGIDFQFSMRFIGATRANGSVINAAISVINKNINGPITLNYQTLGGQFAANRNYVIQTIAQNNYNPRRIAWDQVTNLPPVFPPSGHAQDLDTFTGLRDLIDAVDRIKVAAANTDSIRNELRQHTLNVSDPHNTLALLPKDLIRRPEFEAHTKDFRDPHHTLDILPTDIVRTSQLNTAISVFVTKTELTSQFEARNVFLDTVPLDNSRGDVIFVRKPHMRCMVWDPVGGVYVRAPWHRPGMLQFSYNNPSSIYGYLLVESETVYAQGNYPDLAKAMGLSGIGTFQFVELRGDVLRVLDNGRGKDVNRSNLSFQAGAVMSHNHFLPTSSGFSGTGWSLLDSGTYEGGGIDRGVTYSPWSQMAVNEFPAMGKPPATTYPNPIFPGNNPDVIYDPLAVGNVGRFAAENRVDNTAVPLWISI